MAYCLVANVSGEELRYPLAPGTYSVGARPECDIQLDDPTVSRRHARLEVGEDGVDIVDEGSRNGVKVGARRVERTRVNVGETLAFGGVHARIEAIPAEDLEVAVPLDAPAGIAPPSPDAGVLTTTSSPGPLDELLLCRLPAILRQVRGGATASELAQVVGSACFESLPCQSLEISAAGDGPEVVLFQARRSGREDEAVACEATRHGVTVRAGLPRSHLVDRYRVGIELAAEVVGLCRTDDLGSPPREVVSAAPPLPPPATVSPRLVTAYADAARVAQGSIGVLVLGESGTGKELMARYIHRASPRREGPFRDLNCASLPHDLLEAELFGIEKGVATGVDERPGTFELADGGTLFLDEIGDMALATQGKILRVLQSGETYRLGARRSRSVNVRIVAATNRNLQRHLESGDFRRDLYHRIAGWVVELPPLRQRREDIANLAGFFLARETTRRGIAVRGITRAALDMLQRASWPGNVRQLENEMARAALFLRPGEALDTSRLDPSLAADGPSGGHTLAEAVAEAERRAIASALAAAGGDIDETAQRLDVSRATLYRRMKALSIQS